MTSFAAYIPHRLVGAYMLMGWRHRGVLHGSHGLYCALMVME